MLLTIIGATSCSAEDGVEHEEGFSEVNQALIDNDGDALVVCSLQSVPQDFAVTLEIVGGMFVVSVENRLDTAATLGLSASTMSEQSSVDVELGWISIKPLEQAVQQYPLSRLGLDLAIPTRVQVVAKPLTNSGESLGAEVAQRLYVNIPDVEQFPKRIDERAVPLNAPKGLPKAGIIHAPSVSPPTAVGDGRPTKTTPNAPLALVSKKLCFRANILTQGAGIGEDEWASSSLTIPARGQFIWGLAPGASTWKAFQLDQSGCFGPDSFTIGQWTFDAVSWGYIYPAGGSPGILVNSQDYNAGVNSVDRFVRDVTNSTATQNVSYDASAQMVNWHLVYKSLSQNSGAFTSDLLGKTISVRTDAPAANGSVTVGNTEVRFVSSDHTEKWVVAHEVGHVVHFNEGRPVSGGFLANYALTGPNCATPISHTAFSREYNSAANVEGFASFWAASVWNSESEQDCYSKFSGATIACVGGTFAHPKPYMETLCSDANSFLGHGNETDWQRTYWELVGNGGATIKQVLDFVSLVPFYGVSNHYVQLNTASNDPSVSTVLESRWDTASVNNGIDH